MNITQLLQNDQTGLIQTLASKFGIDSQQVEKALSWIAPAISRGLQQQVKEPTSFESLWNALDQGNHQRYVEQPALLEETATQEDGNSILGHIFGTKEVSRNVAGYTAKETGLSSSLIKKMLPYAATMVMGMLSKQMSSEPAVAASPQNIEAQRGMLSWLDSDRDGSVLDDMLGIAFRSMTS